MPIALPPPNALTPPGPHTASRVACPPFDSADREGVQPSAQLRHVQGHEHVLHVLCALRACPDPQAFSRAPPALRASSDPPALPAPHLTLCIVRAPLSTRQGAAAFNQPLSFETSSVTAMSYMFSVRSARALTPSLQTGPARCAPPRRTLLPSRPRTSPRIVRPPFDSAAHGSIQPASEPPGTPLTLPPPNTLTHRGPHLFPHRMPAFRLCRKRRRSTSCSASTPPASRPCTTCSRCAPRVPWRLQP